MPKPTAAAARANAAAAATAAASATARRSAALAVLLLSIAVGCFIAVDCEASSVQLHLLSSCTSGYILLQHGATPRMAAIGGLVLGHTLTLTLLVFAAASCCHWRKSRVAPGIGTQRLRTVKLQATAPAPALTSTPSGSASAAASAASACGSSGACCSVDRLDGSCRPRVEAAQSATRRSPGGGLGDSTTAVKPPIVDQKGLEALLHQQQQRENRKRSAAASASPPSGTGGLGGLSNGVSPPTRGAASVATATQPFGGLGGYTPFAGGVGAGCSTCPAAQATNFGGFSPSPGGGASACSPPAAFWPALGSPPQATQGYGYGSPPLFGGGVTSPLMPQMSSPFVGASPLQMSPPYGQSVRRVSTAGTDGGSGSKYQRAMYIPSSGDRQEDPSVISRRHAKLLKLLHLEGGGGTHSLLPTWTDRLRRWLSAALLQPLDALIEANQRLLEAAAAKGISMAAPAASNPFSSSLFGPKPAAPAPAATAPAGPAVSVAQWLQHAHTDPAAQALVHQRQKLDRLLQVPGYSAECKQYVRHRIGHLAQGHCLVHYKWDGGASTSSPMPWTASLPTDSELLIHLFCCFFDFAMPAVAAAPTAAQPSKPPGSSSLFGGGFGGGLGVGTSSGFGGSWMLSGGTASAATPTKSGPFWRTVDEQRAFSTGHFAKAREGHRKKSDAVILQQNGRSTADGSKRAPPRYSLMCDGVEWVIADGEHNAFEAMVLFLLQRAKHKGYLDGLDLKQEMHSPLMASLSTAGTARPPPPSDEAAYYAPLAILYPWSRKLEAMALSEVTAELKQ